MIISMDDNLIKVLETYENAKSFEEVHKEKYDEISDVNVRFFLQRINMFVRWMRVKTWLMWLLLSHINNERISSWVLMISKSMDNLKTVIIRVLKKHQ